VNGALWIKDFSNRRLWLKGENNPTARQKYAADVLGLVGVAAPETRPLRPWDARQLYDAVDLTTIDTDVWDEVAKHRVKPYAMLMSHAPGVAAAEAEDADEGKVPTEAVAENFILALNNPDFVQSLGRMMCTDQFLGNYDRLSVIEAGDPRFTAGRKAFHAGNWKLDVPRAHEYVLQTLDNDAIFDHVDYGGAPATIAERVRQAVIGNGDLMMAGVELAFDESRVRALFEEFIWAWKGWFPNLLGNAAIDPTKVRNVYLNRAVFVHHAMIGWRQGQTIIVNNLRALKAHMKEMAAGEFGGPEFNIEDFRVRKVYAQLRAEGVDASTAEALTVKYLEGRAAGGDASPLVREWRAIIDTSTLSPDPNTLLATVRDRERRLRALSQQIVKRGVAGYMGMPVYARDKSERLELRQFVRTVSPADIIAGVATFTATAQSLIPAAPPVAPVAAVAPPVAPAAAPGAAPRFFGAHRIPAPAAAPPPPPPRVRQGLIGAGGRDAQFRQNVINVLGTMTTGAQQISTNMTTLAGRMASARARKASDLAANKPAGW
jgi:hypothetical protein